MQAWTITNEAGDVLYAQFLTSGPDELPSEAGWDHEDGHVYTMIDQIDPAIQTEFNGAVWERDLDEVKRRKWQEIKDARDAKRYGGFVTSKGKVDTDEDSQARISRQAARADRQGAAFSIEWTMFNNNVKNFNAAEMIAVDNEVSQFDAQCQKTAADLRAQIAAATTPEAVDAIQWPA